MYQRLESQRVVFDNGGQQVKKYDPNNTHPYDELEVDEDASGKIISAKPKIDGQPSNNIDFSAVGQVLGSALGRALAPNNQFVQLAASTVVGAVGQKLAQAFSESLATNGATFDLSTAFTDLHISIAGAGASSVASFLTAEIGTALGLQGFGAQLFNASVGGFTGSVASQISTKLAQGFSFDAAVGFLDFGAAATNAGYGISSLLGGYLGRELVPAQTHEGAVGGQLLGAVGSALALSASIAYGLGAVLNFIMPGIGSLVGTILGTLIGDALGSHPHPAAVDLIDQAGALYGFTHSQVSASDGGDWSIPDQMAPAAVSIINAYLKAVNGVELDHSKQIQIGYVTDPDFRYISGWAPTHDYRSFIHPDDAVHAAALDALQHLEVIGGDLLMKRAHQNSASNVPEVAPGGGNGPTLSAVSSSDQLVTMSADLSVAQDYENYLNNREAINALIAANPNSAFAAGWIATFARVNDLGLNHMGKSDFLGGLVGYLDSVDKAGLGAEAANAIVKRGSDNSVIVEIKVANGAEVPGALSVFADHLTITSDASGQTLQFTVDNGLNASGTLLFGPGAGTAGHDIMVGGAADDVFTAGGGWDFVDGGAGSDHLYGEGGNDILRGGRGTDFLFGAQGNDTYVFTRGDGVDTVYDDYRPLTFVPGSVGGGLGGTIGGGLTGTYQNVPADGGSDSLVFGTGIALSDIEVQLSGNNLIVAIKDPAHPGVAFSQLADKMTLQDWGIAFNRIEKFVFADGTTLDLSSGALSPLLVPFGESLSRSSVVEGSAIGTKIGTVSGFDFNPNVALSYSLLNPDGRFAINASTGELTVAGAISYDPAHSPQITVRASDGANVFDKAFTINVIDINQAPTDITLSGGTAPEDSPGGTIIATAHGIDPDPGTTLHYSLTDNAGGRFLIYQNGEIAIVDRGLIDFETASSYHIKVKAADQSGLSVEKDFTLHVTDVYEGPFGFEPATAPLSAFAIGAGGWSSQELYPRLLADVNGDGMADIVGFSAGGVTVARATGNGHFAAATDETGTFGFSTGWSSQNLYPRLLGDVNGDGMADIVAFGAGGVSVARAIGNGHFAAPTDETGTFGFSSGWSSQNEYPRLLGDVNGDGMADIVGFGAGGVSVSRAIGNGHFAAPTDETGTFGFGAGGWVSQNQYPRLLGDVNGDGMADIVGFGADGVYVSLATGGGHFASPVGGIENFGFLAHAGGWASQDQYPRLLADVNGDGMADIVGFSADMAIVSLATGNGHFAAPLAGARNFTVGSGGWASQDLYPRGLGDVNGDGRADIIGFGHDGVFEALSNGFAPADVTLSGGSAPEDSVGGTIIATAHGIDAFPGAVLTYSLTDNAGGRFLIYQGGEIAIVNRGLMSYEAASSYHVKVRAADQYGSYAERDFTLHVTDVNEAPTGAMVSGGGSVVENAATGTYVATVTGIDPDAGTIFSYSLLNQDSPFAIDAQTGEITVIHGAMLDHEFAGSYDIRVRIADQYALAFEKSWTLTITNANEAPTAARLFGGTVREHSPNGTHVATVIGTDPDAGDGLSYSLLTDAGGRFEILNPSSGVITVKDGTLLDYVTAQSHSLMVRTTDQAGLFYDIPLKVALAAGPINNPDGTSTVTIYDGANAYYWKSFTSTYNGPNGHGSLLSQLGINDSGSKWQNVFDVAHAYNWNYYVETLGLNDNVLTRMTGYDDGTRSMLVNDPGNASWSSFTMNFNVSGPQTWLSDVVMDNAGSTPIDNSGAWAALDAITWYGRPYSVGPAPAFLLSDFNGDGKTDMLLQNNGTGGLYICEMNGAQIGVNGLSGTLATGWHYGGLGDFNGDRKSDWVLLNDATHQVYVCEMDGTAIGTNDIVANVRADLGWYYKGLGDFNNDGKSDLILFNDLTHGVYICEMDGLQMRDNGLVGTVDDGFAYKTLGDFNGDGKHDFLFLNDTTHDVKVWQIDGTALVDHQTVGTIDAAAGWRFQDTADFNGDGKTDLLLLNDANSHVMIWQMNGTSAATEVDLGAAPDHFHFASTGDFNGDGKTDLFFQNDATRAVQLWQMNGTEILQNSQMALLADGWHMVV